MRATVFQHATLPTPVRVGGAAVVAATLLLAGYLRFDAGAAGAGRVAVVATWLLVAVGARAWYRSAIRPLVERQLAEPGGYEAFREEARRQKLAEWDGIRRRGARWFVLRRASWVALLLWTLAYSAAVLLAPTPAHGPSPAPALRFLVWAAAAGVAAGALAVVHALRTWRAASRSWAAAAVSAPPA